VKHRASVDPALSLLCSSMAARVALTRVVLAVVLAPVTGRSALRGDRAAVGPRARAA
jgi:hypothetical protein